MVPDVKHALQMGLFTVVSAFMAAAMRGDWIIALVHIWKQYDPSVKLPTEVPLSNSSLQENQTSGEVLTLKPSLEYLEGVHWFVLLSLAVSFVTYLGMGGLLQWQYYIKRKHEAAEWKCQPTRWLTPANERHEIMLGSLNMAIGGSISGVIACYVINGGPTTMYFSAGEHGWPYLIISTVLVFLYQDAGAYYIHRLSHIPAIYRPIHKHHHRYHSPTAFSATAMHPAEFVVYQALMASPIFVVPIYSGSFVFLLFYGYYYGMIDHSGIKMDALWPWQPESMFHDDHHRYFHTNFGFNTKLWDWLHDTLRINTRVYGEDIFYGKGKEDGEKTK